MIDFLEGVSIALIVVALPLWAAIVVYRWWHE